MQLMNKRVALLGAGHFASVYKRVLEKISYLTLAFVFSRSEDRARVLVDGRADIYIASGNVMEAIKQLPMHEIDFCIVCLPIQLHFSVIKELLSAGIATLSEKPIAETAELGLQLLDLQKSLASPPRWAVAENYRYEPALYRARELIKSCKVLSFSFVIHHKVLTDQGVFLSQWRKSAGFLIDSGVHYIAFLRGVLQASSFRVLSSVARKVHSQMPGKADTLYSTIECGDTVGQIVMSFGQFHALQVRLLISCVEGDLIVERGPGYYDISWQGGEKEHLYYGGIEREVEIFARGTGTDEDFKLINPSEALIDLQLMEEMMNAGHC